MAEPHQRPQNTPDLANIAYYRHLQNTRTISRGPGSSNSMATQPEFSHRPELLHQVLGSEYTSLTEWSARQYAGMAEMRARLGPDAPPMAIGVSFLPDEQYRPQPNANVPIPHTNPNLPSLGRLQANDPSVLAQGRDNNAIGHTSHLANAGQSYRSPYVEQEAASQDPVPDQSVPGHFGSRSRTDSSDGQAMPDFPSFSTTLNDVEHDVLGISERNSHQSTAHTSSLPESNSENSREQDAYQGSGQGDSGNDPDDVFAPTSRPGRRSSGRSDDSDHSSDYDTAGSTAPSHGQRFDIYTGSPVPSDHDDSYIAPCADIPNGSSQAQIEAMLSSGVRFDPLNLPPAVGQPDRRLPVNRGSITPTHLLRVGPSAISAPRSQFNPARSPVEPESRVSEESDELHYLTLLEERVLEARRRAVLERDLLNRQREQERREQEEQVIANEFRASQAGVYQRAVAEAHVALHVRRSNASIGHEHGTGTSNEVFPTMDRGITTNGVNQLEDQTGVFSLPSAAMPDAPRGLVHEHSGDANASQEGPSRTRNTSNTAQTVTPRHRRTSSFNPEAAPYTPSRFVQVPAEQDPFVERVNASGSTTHTRHARNSSRSNWQATAIVEMGTLPESAVVNGTEIVAVEQQRPRQLSEAAQRRAAHDLQVAKARARAEANGLMFDAIMIPGGVSRAVRAMTGPAALENGDQGNAQGSTENDRRTRGFTVTPRRASRAIVIKTPDGAIVPVSTVTSTAQDATAASGTISGQATITDREHALAMQKNLKMLQLVGRGGQKPLYDIAMLDYNMPFETTVLTVALPSEDNCKLTGMLRISGIPYQIPTSNIIAFLGSVCRFAKIPEFVHIIMDRMTGKTMDAFVEFVTPKDAWDAANRHIGHSKKLGGRVPTLEVVGHDDFMKALFSKSRATVKWTGGRASIVPHDITSDSLTVGFQGFVHKEELVALAKGARTFANSSYGVKAAPQRLYESTISTLIKYPWYLPEHITVEDRDELFGCTLELIKELGRYIEYHVGPEHNTMNMGLLRRLETAAMNCVGFSVLQLSEIAKIAKTEARNLLTIQNAQDYEQFRTIGVKPEAFDNIVTYYQAIIRDHVGATGSKRNNVFGNFTITYPEDSHRLSLLETTDIEWSELTRVLRMALPNSRLGNANTMDPNIFSRQARR